MERFFTYLTYPCNRDFIRLIDIYKIVLERVPLTERDSYGRHFTHLDSHTDLEKMNQAELDNFLKDLLMRIVDATSFETIGIRLYFNHGTDRTELIANLRLLHAITVALEDLPVPDRYSVGKDVKILVIDASYDFNPISEEYAKQHLQNRLNKLGSLIS